MDIECSVHRGLALTYFLFSSNAQYEESLDGLNDEWKAVAEARKALEEAEARAREVEEVRQIHMIMIIIIVCMSRQLTRVCVVLSFYLLLPVLEGDEKESGGVAGQVGGCLDQ